MTLLRLRYVHRFKDRHGTVRHYFRRPNHTRVTLPGLPGSAEFMDAYQAALAGTTAPHMTAGEGRTLPGSFSALVVSYYASTEFQQLATVTKATYRNLIERLRSQHGDKPIALLRREDVRRMVAAKAEQPAAANSLLKTLRILMRLALDDGWIKTDPTHGVRRVQYRTEGFHAWSEEEIAAFEARHAHGSRAQLALILLLCTGQRPGDVTRMGRQHVKAGRLAVLQQKTGTRLSIPIHSDLSSGLETIPAGQLPFLATAAGAPFTPAGFSQWFSECARAAGLVGCTAHGLRKAAARRLAEAGCSAHEIASITGHRTLREVERYTRDADQRRLADGAMRGVGARPKNIP